MRETLVERNLAYGRLVTAIDFIDGEVVTKQERIDHLKPFQDLHLQAILADKAYTERNNATNDD